MDIEDFSLIVATGFGSAGSHVVFVCIFEYISYFPFFSITVSSLFRQGLMFKIS